MLAKQPIGMLVWGHETDIKSEKQQRNGEWGHLLHRFTLNPVTDGPQN